MRPGVENQKPRGLPLMRRSAAARVAAIALFALVGQPAAFAGESPRIPDFHKDIRRILENYCFDCHGAGESKGNVTFDEFKSDQGVLENHDLCLKALKNVRAGLMPPPKNRGRSYHGFRSSPIPKGLCPPAHGCEARATLGLVNASATTATRLRPVRRSDAASKLETFAKGPSVNAERGL
jgi:hypothetical protein